MIRYLCTVFSLLVFLGGCVGYHDVSRQRLEGYPQHHSRFDAELGWQVRPEGSQTLIDGEFRNLRFPYMDDVEIWVAVLDTSGRQVARSVSYLIPQEIRQDDIVPFSLTLPVYAPSGTRLRFTYNYNASEGGDDRGGFITQTFETSVP